MWTFFVVAVFTLTLQEAKADTVNSYLDNKVYYVFDCTIAQQLKIVEAIDHARKSARSAITVLENDDTPVSKPFEVMFGTTTFLQRRVLHILRKVPPLEGSSIRQSYHGAENQPEFYCANEDGPKRNLFDGDTGAAYCLSQKKESDIIAMSLQGQPAIVLCEPFWAQPEPKYYESWPSKKYCPTVTRLNEWDEDADRLTRFQSSTILHELVHFYLPCGGRDFVGRKVAEMNKCKVEVYGLLACVTHPEDLRIRNPDNFCNFVSLTYHGCTKLVDPYWYPFRRQKPRPLGDDDHNSTSPFHERYLNESSETGCGGDRVIGDTLKPSLELPDGASLGNSSLGTSSKDNIEELV